MRLCSLELQGFKSFPDKTFLEFDDGITAVVGPNGSGKSNIADAMRWVFGEQSTKTLRGGKMEDVIFSGTQERKSVGYASVKLTIEDKSNAESGEDGKVTIGRRLYRSGESEYTINGSAVRLRDVTEFFMDTGMGRDGYSIIGQGRISEIVSAKSMQRREIFEEAAGISKFRYRRTEAQKRLLSAEDNLIRLKDILLELEDRVGPLKIQSEKAQKFLIYSKERKELEISIWISRLDSLKTSMAEQENKILIAKNDYEILEAESEANENKVNELYGQMQEYSMSADQLRGVIREKEEERSQNNATVAVLKNDMEHNLQALEKLERDIDGIGQGGGKIEAQLEEKTGIFQGLEKQIIEMENMIATKEEQIEKRRLESGELHQKLDSSLVRKNAVLESINQIKVERAANRTAVTESGKRLEEIKESDNDYDRLIKEHGVALEECLEQIRDQGELIGSIENTKNGYLMKRRSRENAQKEVLERFRKLEEDVVGANSRVKLLEDMEAAMDGYQGSVKFIINQNKKGLLAGIYGAVSSIISTEPMYITAIEIALGSAMQNLVVENESTAKQGIEALKNAKIGRATFLPLTSVRGTAYNFSGYEQAHGFVGGASKLVKYDPKFEGIINQLLGRICIVDDLNTGMTIAKQAGYKFRVVTLDGQVINAGGSYTGGAVSRSIGTLARRNEILELREKTKKLATERQILAPSIKEMNEEIGAIDASMVGADAEIRSGEEEKVRLGFAKEQIERSLETAVANSALAKGEVDKLVERLRLLEEGELTAEQVVAESQSEAESLERSIEEIREKITNLQSKGEAFSNEVQRYRLEKLGLEKDVQAGAEEIQRMKLQMEDADSQLERTQKEKGKFVEGNNLLKEKILEIELRQTGFGEEIENHNTRIKDFMEQRNQLEKTTTQLRQEERESSGKREGVSRELSRLEERQAGMQREYDGVIENMWDEYQLTRSAAMEIAVSLEDPIKANGRLTDLRNRIRGLGSVNLAAVEEYSEVSERYEFLSAQLGDVEGAKAQLEKLIDELTGEMRTIFKENFDKIAREFSITFVELFGGGKAELALVEADDVLEAGIEIYVQPPGKVIKNLSLLSGGEQAFVAIAIYFAILKVKPAPFVILDEIEAALDDVNVVRYATYLRTLATSTQFIAITHRRGTMEEADVLYGVTMQENGVSKLLELKVSEIENKLGMEAE